MIRLRFVTMRNLGCQEFVLNHVEQIWQYNPPIDDVLLRRLEQELAVAGISGVYLQPYVLNNRCVGISYCKDLF